MTRVVVAVIFALLALPAAANAELVVTSTEDHAPDGCAQPPVGDCTLREALAAPRPPDNTIVVPSGDYALGSALTIGSDATIIGDGARSTTIRLDDQSTGRVLFVDSLAAVNLSGVLITGANDATLPGGGILVEAGGELHLADSAIEGNTADRGGGIFSSGTLVIERSTIARNNAAGGVSGFGGGIHVAAGTASLENTTVSGNSAEVRGGGIYTQANLDLTNVTIADNFAGTGAFGDGGGLYQSFGASTTLRTLAVNTLVARNVGGNCAGTAVNPDNSVAHPIQSTNGLSDEVAQPSCNVTGPNNQLVADTRVGTLANNGGPTDTHALLTGSPGIDRGAAAGCPAADQRGISRPRGAACDVGAYEFVPAPLGGPPPPPPPDDGDDELPPPVLHKNVNALPKSGTVKVKLPGSDKFVELVEGQQIPLGTIIDTRKGRITIVAAAGSGQTADFYAGLFKITQTKGKKPITVLTLVEKLSCAKKKKKANAAAKKRKKRRLWGDGKGRFRTKGKHSAATVVGTKWLVEDRCRSTLTRVVRGKVRVRDFVKKKTVTVKAGKKYVARARR